MDQWGRPPQVGAAPDPLPRSLPSARILLSVRPSARPPVLALAARTDPLTRTYRLGSTCRATVSRTSCRFATECAYLLAPATLTADVGVGCCRSLVPNVIHSSCPQVVLFHVKQRLNRGVDLWKMAVDNLLPPVDNVGGGWTVVESIRRIDGRRRWGQPSRKQLGSPSCPTPLPQCRTSPNGPPSPLRAISASNNSMIRSLPSRPVAAKATGNAPLVAPPMRRTSGLASGGGSVRWIDLPGFRWC